MARIDAWKILSPEEQLVQLIRDVARLKDQLRQYTIIQGVRLEGRKVGTERHLFAVVDDDTATNNGDEVQILP
jgi:molybdopterin converting factor small subunit